MTDKRKVDHLALANRAQIGVDTHDKRFNYEPLFTTHPHSLDSLKLQFGPWNLQAPLWISSMTGGTQEAKQINYNLARVAGEFGLGMGLGSCRPLLDSLERLDDFKVKHLMPNTPLLANLGVAQLEQEISFDPSLDRILKLIDLLDVDGIIIHINPLQEWLQPGGDLFKRKPIESIEYLLTRIQLPVIVKEVGQGMGPKSMHALMKLPLVAIEFGAFGGTNFSQLEILRGESRQDSYTPLCHVGHSSLEMVEMVNDIKRCSPQERLVDNFIISGGIKSFLDGFYLCQKVNACAIYGQAKIILDHARGEYDTLASFIDGQLRGYACAKASLEVKG